MWSLSLVMSECCLSERGQGHVSNLYIVDLKNFTTARRRYTGDIHNSIVRGRFVYDTYRTMEATQSRHGWVHMFITHCPTVTLQLHNFDFCSGLVVQVVSALLHSNWQDLNWHDASRGFSAIAELLVLSAGSTCRSEIFKVQSLGQIPRWTEVLLFLEQPEFPFFLITQCKIG